MGEIRKFTGARAGRIPRKQPEYLGGIDNIISISSSHSEQLHTEEEVLSEVSLTLLFLETFLLAGKQMFEENSALRYAFPGLAPQSYDLPFSIDLCGALSTDVAFSMEYLLEEYGEAGKFLHDEIRQISETEYVRTIRNPAPELGSPTIELHYPGRPAIEDLPFQMVCSLMAPEPTNPGAA